VGVQWGKEETQQGWQMQDMAWNRQMAGFQYEYQQDELERSIRLATGREKQGLLRRREYQEEMYARQEDRRGVEEERAKQVMEWERQKFSLQKEHFERVNSYRRCSSTCGAAYSGAVCSRQEKIEQQKQDKQLFGRLRMRGASCKRLVGRQAQQYPLEELERQNPVLMKRLYSPTRSKQHDLQLESMKYQAQALAASGN
jgi:hypothetical protein